MRRTRCGTAVAMICAFCLLLALGGCGGDGGSTAARRAPVAVRPVRRALRAGGCRHTNGLRVVDELTNAQGNPKSCGAEARKAATTAAVGRPAEQSSERQDEVRVEETPVVRRLITKFVGCMREAGVVLRRVNTPAMYSATGVDTNSPTVQAATRGCRSKVLGSLE